MEAGVIVDRVESGRPALSEAMPVIDMRGLCGTAVARAHVLEDPTGRRARRMARAGRAVGALFLLWVVLLTLGGIGLLPVDGIPLGRVLRPEAVAAPEPSRSVAAERARPGAGTVPARRAVLEPRDAAAPSRGNPTTRSRTPRSAVDVRRVGRRTHARVPARSQTAPREAAPVTTAAPQSAPAPSGSGAGPAAVTTTPTVVPAPTTPSAPPSGSNGTAPGSGKTTGASGTAPGSGHPTGSSGTSPGSGQATGASGTAPGSGHATGASGTAPGSGKPTGPSKDEGQGPKKPVT